MIKSLVKHGNSWTVTTGRPILGLLKIATESQVELTTDGKSIRIAPVNSDDVKAKVGFFSMGGKARRVDTVKT